MRQREKLPGFPDPMLSEIQFAVAQKTLLKKTSARPGESVVLMVRTMRERAD